MKIWCNTMFDPAATRLLREGLSSHTLLEAASASFDVLVPGSPDAALVEADVAFGQPAPAQLLGENKLRWVQLSTAGYTRYDRDDLRAALHGREIPLTTSSDVFADPCAQHVLAMMLGRSRQLMQSYRDQITDRRWNYEARRYDSRLLTGQSALLFGFGAIGRRLAELLAPFGMDVAAVRRTPTGNETIRLVAADDVMAELGRADHVINLLPDNAGTRQFFGASRFDSMKQGACFYNVGRGTTVNQEALLGALESGQLGCACLDVMDPEPLPTGHPLWAAPNCYITPHTAGGRLDQDEALVRHFLTNLARFGEGKALVNQVI